MSRKTNIGKKPILRDYGIQPYRACDKGYSDVMRTATFKAAHDAVVIKESEFAKPYGDVEEVGEDYGGMEYAAPRIPSIDYPGIDFPGMGIPVPDFGEIYNPWHLTFYCSPDLCWCEGEEKCATANCTYEIVKVEFAYFSYPEWSLTWTKNRICITAPADASGSPSINITMRANIPKGGGLWQGKFDVVYGTHGNISISECRASVCCSGVVTEWDLVNSAYMITRETSGTVFIVGSGADIDWSISGTGWSIVGNGLSAEVSADVTACGVGTITATSQCDGSTAEGYVRSNVGSWVYCAAGWDCASCYGYSFCGSGTHDVYYNPAYKLRVYCPRMVPTPCDPCCQGGLTPITSTCDGIVINAVNVGNYLVEGHDISNCVTLVESGDYNFSGNGHSQKFEC